MSSQQHGPNGPGVVELRVVSGGTTAGEDTTSEVESKDDSSPAVTRTKFELPPEVAPATRGVRGLVWKLLKPLYTRTGWSWLCVNPLVNPSTGELIERAEAELYESHCKDNGYTITVVPSKGGVGKTHTVAVLSTLYAWITGQAIGAVDVNPSEGNLHTRLGVDKTVNILGLLRNYLVNLPLRVRNHSLMIQDVGKHPVKGLHNVHVVRFDDGTRRVKAPEPERRIVKKLLLACRQAFHTAIYDTGNSLYSPWTLGAAEISDVILISLVPWMENAETGAKSTLERLIELSPEITSRIIIVVNGEKRKITDQVVANYASRFNHPVENVVVLPYDRIFEPLPVPKTDSGATEQPVRIVDIRNARPATQLASLRFAIRIAEVAEANRRELVINEPPKEEESEKLQ